MNLSCSLLALPLLFFLAGRGVVLGSPTPLTYTVREMEDRVRLGIYTVPRMFDDEDETYSEEGSGGRELDLSNPLVGDIHSSIASLYSLTSDLKKILANKTGDFNDQVLPAMDEFQAQMENFTKSTAVNLQCQFMRRIQESMEIMDRIYTLSPEQIEEIKTQVGNISFIHQALEAHVADSNSTEIAIKENPPKDCADAFYKGYFTSGVTPIRIDRHDRSGKTVWCDQETDGGGWTVILRRQPSPTQMDFRRNWESYEEGFGDVHGEYWIGLKTLHLLTKRQPHKLRVEIAAQGDAAVALYDTFRVGPSWRKYRLRVDDFDELLSTAGDALEYHDGQKFSTFDDDNDGATGGNCANWSGGGGWWYDFCYFSNPTGLYSLPNNTGESDQYMEWRMWKGHYNYLSHIVMMIRPHDVTTI